MKPENETNLFRVLFTAVWLIIAWLAVETVYPPFRQGAHPLLQGLHLTEALVLVVVVALLRVVRKQQRLRQESTRLQALQSMRREAEKNERRYQCLLESAGDAIFVIRFADGFLEEVNNAAEELLGYSREELGRLTGWDLVPPEDQKGFTALVAQVKRTGRAGPCPITFRKSDGTLFLGEVNVRLIELGEEKVVQAIIRDISLKKQAEYEIRLRNRKLSLLNNIIVRASQNLDLPSVLDVTLNETIAGCGAAAGTIHLLLPSGEEGELVAHCNTDDGFLAAARPGLLADGSSCGITVSHTCMEVSDRSSCSCGMAELALKQGWKSIVGVPLFAKKRLVGIMHLMSTPERQFSSDDLKFFTTMGNQLGIVIEHARLFAELNWKTEELLRSHALLERSSHQLVHSQQRLRHNLSAVEQANQELTRLSRMKNNFLGMVSHEFRTPLTGILSSSELLLTCGAELDSASRQKLFETIHQCGNRLNQIVTDLLMVAQLEANQVTPSTSVIHLKDVLHQVRTESEPLLAQRRQKLVIPDLTGLPHFEAEQDSLREVFTRLLENASKFTLDGGEIVIAARVVAQEELLGRREIICRFNPSFFSTMGHASYLLVEVCDSGVGIPRDEQLQVFEKFYVGGDVRFHSSGKDKFLGGGPGLGLAIVKGMVEAHGGMIWVQSPLTETGGASFSVLLPLEKPLPPPASLSTGTPRQPSLFEP